MAILIESTRKPKPGDTKMSEASRKEAKEAGEAWANGPDESEAYASDLLDDLADHPEDFEFAESEPS